MGALIPLRSSGRRRRTLRDWRAAKAWEAQLARHRPLIPADIRVMLWAGLLAGLLFHQAQVRWPDRRVPAAATAPTAPPAASPAPDPWAEAQRSAEILRRQEGAPSAAAIRGGTAVVAHPAAVRVIDGDTFDHGGVRIRMADIDTPEIFSPRCAREAELGARAARRLRALVAEGPFELVPIDRDEDRYGRKLRIAMRDGRPIGDILVAEGLARRWDGGRRSWCG